MRARDEVVEALRREGLEVRDDAGTRAMYASDASLYRIPPLAVVRPRDEGEVAASLAVARATGVPITSRGAGTSVAGNAIGRGIVLDFSRHFNRVLSLDPEARTATVEPGTVHAVLQRAAAPHGLRFGPDPSTHPRCTVGGMIGNDACGSRSLAYGRTSDNVDSLRILTAAGTVIEAGHRGDSTWSRGGEEILTEVRRVMGQHLATARTEFDRFGRQVSGYAVQHLLPERFDLARALVGSEGTLGIVTEATVRLVTDAPVRVLTVLGFDDIVAAGSASTGVVAHGPISCEGLDSRLVEVLRSRRGDAAVPPLPRGRAWLFVEFAGDRLDEARARAAQLVAETAATDAMVVTDPADQARLWRIREDGAGLAGRAPSGQPAWPGWEDAAVPPARLGDYLARFDELVDSFAMTSAPFGHFGEGCMHVRLDFPLERTDGATVLKEFLVEAAKLVGEFGGSLSGEHGDGRARSELLPHMYSDDAIELFRHLKHAFDPEHLLNPGVLVDPDPVDSDLRLDGSWAPVTEPTVRRTQLPARRTQLAAGRPRLPVRLAMAYPEDEGDLSRAVHRCTGVGKCRADNTASGGVMCPSYLATREEKDSTRGRARVLQEVVRGELAWSAPEVHDALDLCLSCKGCASDCPTGIDMATYKSEVLHQIYRRRLRPRSHYSLGRLPLWAALASRIPRIANALMQLPLLGTLLLRIAGVDPRRSIPRFARRSFLRSFGGSRAQGRPVLLFADSFSNHFDPEVLDAVVRVLTRAGWAPYTLPQRECCGLTWVTTGQLDAARRILTRTVRALAPAARDGVPIVGVEPSCTAVLRNDTAELLPDDPDAIAVAGATRTLAELLTETPGYQPPDLADLSVVVQPHCHQHAVIGFDVDAALLARTGARIDRLSGCCGLAGNFGVEQGHYDVSVAIAGQQLLPAIDAAPTAVVLADGFSCRTQVSDLRDRPSLHLAQLLDR